MYLIIYGNSEKYKHIKVSSYEEGKNKFLEIINSIDSMKIANLSVSYVELRNNKTHSSCRFFTKNHMEYVGIL
jgi:hypothetical protein